MMANMENLPEVKAAYGSQPTPTSTTPTTLTTQPTVTQSSTSGLTSEQISGLQVIYNGITSKAISWNSSKPTKSI